MTEDLRKAQAAYDGAEPDEGECHECKRIETLKSIGFGLDDYLADSFHKYTDVTGVLVDCEEEVTELKTALADALARRWSTPNTPCQDHNPSWEDYNG